MIRHIKRVAILLLLLTFVSCSGNKILEGSKSDSSDIAQITDEAINYGFFRSFQFCDNPYAAFTAEEANSIYAERKIRLKNKQERKAIDWNAFFYEGAKQCVENELGEKINSSYLITTNEEAPFNELVVCNDTYVVVAQDGFFFAFAEGKTIDRSIIQGNEKPVEKKGSLKSVVDALEESKSLSLPIEYSYDFIMELSDFVTLNDVPEIPQVEYLSDLQFAKLPSCEKTDLLLVSGYLESGQSELHLLTLDKTCACIDRKKLYTHQETEDGGVVTKFKIGKDFKVSVSKEMMVDRTPQLIEEKQFKIDAKGNFVQLDQ